jgi:hypothetical protein
MQTTVLQGSEFKVSTRFFFSDDEPVNLTGGTFRVMVKLSVSDADGAALLDKNSTDTPEDFEVTNAASGYIVAVIGGDDLLGVQIGKDNKVNVFIQQEAVTSGGHQYRSSITEVILSEALIKS